MLFILGDSSSSTCVCKMYVFYQMVKKVVVDTIKYDFGIWNYFSFLPLKP